MARFTLARRAQRLLSAQHHVNNLLCRCRNDVTTVEHRAVRAWAVDLCAEISGGRAAAASTCYVVVLGMSAWCLGISSGWCGQRDVLAVLAELVLHAAADWWSAVHAQRYRTEHASKVHPVASCPSTA